MDCSINAPETPETHPQTAADEAAALAPTAVNGTAPPPVAEEDAFEALDLHEQLNFILEHVHHSRWFQDEYMQVLIAHCTSSITWAQISSRFKQIGGNAWHLDNIAKDVRAAAKQTRRAPAAAARQDPDATGTAPPLAASLQWVNDLFRTKAGVLETDNNLQAIFAQHPDWAGRFAWDVVANRAYVDQEPLDIHYVRNHVVPWLGITMEMPVRHSKNVLEVLRSHARCFPRDPIQEWLATLPLEDTDDPDRTLLDTWLCTYAGVDDTPYSRFVSRILIVSLIARAMQPGIQYRYVVVLEGRENAGKTQLLRRLGDRWHQEFPKSVEGKEAYMQLQGYWLVELGELDALKPAQETRIKMFISQQMDVWVPKYENDPTERPRRAVLVGTTNEREYLKGQHGDTRYLPIWLEGPIQLAKIADLRARLFTQGKAFLKAYPDTWWCIPDDAEEEVARAREARREPGVFEDALRKWLGGEARHTCTVAEALEYLMIPKASWTKRLEMEIGSAIKGCGWHRVVEYDTVEKKMKRHWAKLSQPTIPEVPF